MRLYVLAGGVLLVALLAACSETPSSLDQSSSTEVDLPLMTSFSHAPTPGRCYSATQTPLAPHQEEEEEFPLLTTQAEWDAAYAADANGNGWVCLNLDENGELLPEGERTDFDDDFASCTSGYEDEYVGEGHPADEDGNGFVCVSTNNPDDVQDDGDNSSVIIPGPFPGPITCPSGYFAVEVTSLSMESYDENGNGWVCLGGDIFTGFEYTDDLAAPPIIPTMTLTQGKVNGHGTYQVEGETLSFSFHGQSDGEAVKGNFEFHNRATGVRYHGELTCMEVEGESVFLEGKLTLDKAGNTGADTRVIWTAVDRGEGKNAPADEVSAPEADGLWTEACGTYPGNSPTEIMGGNVQVK